MGNNFLKQSKNLLLNFLREPWGFSFFPSSFFWSNEIDYNISNYFSNYFNSKFYNLDDTNNKLNLYIHIPFCTKICSYCNCFKRQIKHDEEINIYIKYVDKEIYMIYKLNNNKKIKINTIFIWWWTPNLLSINQFKKLYLIIEKYFDLKDIEQFLIDGHPNYYTKEKIDYFKYIWVNRITFAIQTFDEKNLKDNNRDIYNISTIKNNIDYLNELWIKSNIDLLIWLKWQTFKLIQTDIDYLSTMKVDNVSVHYLMKSNNINYSLDDNYIDLVEETKNYLKYNKLPISSSNVLEDYFASKRNTTIAIWASCVTNIYSELIYIKPWIRDYYKMLDLDTLTIYKWVEMCKKDEMIKYIYLNILFWININVFKKLYWKDLFREFIFEFKFLNNNNIIDLKDNIIYSKKSDYETLIYFNIFFREKLAKIPINNYNEAWFRDFFLESWELIDK